MKSRTDTKIAFKRYSFERDLRKIMRRSHIPMFYEVWFKWHKLHKEKKLHYKLYIFPGFHGPPTVTVWFKHGFIRWFRMDDSKLLNHVSKVWKFLCYNKRLVQHLYWTSYKVNAFESIQNVIMVIYSTKQRLYTNFTI